jgi:hypothetical protein
VRELNASTIDLPFQCAISPTERIRVHGPCQAWTSSPINRLTLRKSGDCYLAEGRRGLTVTEHTREPPLRWRSSFRLDGKLRTTCTPRNDGSATGYRSESEPPGSCALFLRNGRGTHVVLLPRMNASFRVDRPPEIFLLVWSRLEPRQAAARLEAWALDDLRREALDSGDPDVLHDWAETVGPIDEVELGVGD